MKAGEMKIKSVFLLILISFFCLILFAPETKSLVKLQVMKYKAGKNVWSTMVSNFVKRDSITYNDYEVLEVLLSTGTYKIYKPEFRERYFYWNEFLKIESDLADTEYNTGIGEIIRGDEESTLMPLVLDYIVLNKKFYYTKDILYLLNKNVFTKMQKYLVFEKIYLVTDANGSIRRATKEEKNYIEKRMYIDNKRKYNDYIKNGVIKAVYLSSLSRELELEFFGGLAYLDAVAEQEKNNSNINSCLSNFFNEFITPPFYTIDASIETMDPDIYKYFVSIYLKYNSQTDYLKLCQNRYSYSESGSLWSIVDRNQIKQFNIELEKSDTSIYKYFTSIKKYKSNTAKVMTLEKQIMNEIYEDLQLGMYPNYHPVKMFFIKLGVFLLIHLIYIFLFKKYYINKGISFYIPIYITIISSSFVLHFLLMQINYYRIPILLRITGLVSVFIIFFITKFIFRKKIALSKEGD